MVKESKGDFVDTMRVAWAIQRECDGGGPATVPENKLWECPVLSFMDESDRATRGNAQQRGEHGGYESREA